MYTGTYMYTIRPEDVGRRHSILRDHTNKYNNILEPLGTVLEGDVGKQIWLQDGAYCVENDQQRDKRIATTNRL